MWSGLERVVGAQRVAQARALPEDQQLEALLGDAYWGLHAAGAAGAVDGYLAVPKKNFYHPGGRLVEGGVQPSGASATLCTSYH